MTATACIPKRYSIIFAATRKVGLDLDFDLDVDLDVDMHRLRANGYPFDPRKKR